MGGSTRQTHTGMRRPARQGILGLLAVLLLIGSLPGLGPAQAGGRPRGSGQWATPTAAAGHE